MRKVYLIIGTVLVAILMILQGCAKKIPETELQAAREALEKVKQVGATELEEYKIAERYLKEAEALIEGKKYDDARTKAIVSKEFSELALKKWEEVKKKEKEGKIELVEREPEFKEAKLPSPFEIKGINPDDVLGTATLGRGYILKQFKKIYFDFDSTAIREDFKDVLKENAEIAKRILEANSGINLLIEGHCDERGTSEYNIELGWRRAQAIKRYLTLLGVPEDRIVTVSFGKEFPEVPCPPPHCSSEEKWSKNRRGVFAITVKD